MLAKRAPVSFDFSTLGGYWANPGKITYSIVPDGTVVFSSPRQTSDLYAKVPTGFVTATQSAATMWAAACNINLTYVSDDGSNIGSTGGSYGHIRVCGCDLGGFGGTGMPAGEDSPLDSEESATGANYIILNTNSGITWRLDGNSYDYRTIVGHELGHGLGLYHSSDSYAVMYTNYNGKKWSLEPDDVYGIQSIYGPRSILDSSIFDLMLFNGSGVYPYV